MLLTATKRPSSELQHTDDHALAVIVRVLQLIPSGDVIIMVELTAAKSDRSGLQAILCQSDAAAVRVVHVETAAVALALEVRILYESDSIFDAKAVVPDVVKTVFPYVLMYPVKTAFPALSVPLTRASPDTSKVVVGLSVPIPTLPRVYEMSAPDETHGEPEIGVPLTVNEPV